MDDVFKSRNRIQRSPQLKVKSAANSPSEAESGFMSDFLNVSKNLRKLEKKDRVENVRKNRKSVSFSIPTSSSTLYNAEESTGIEDLSKEFENLGSTEVVNKLSSEANELIDFINEIPVPDQNRISQSNYGFSVLVHYNAAELSYSTLKDNTTLNHNVSLLEESTTETQKTPHKP